MLKCINVLRVWPISNLIKSVGCFYLLYISREHIRINMLKCQALYNNFVAKLDDKDRKLNEIKHLMFNEAFSMLRNRSNDQDNINELIPSNTNILEIGIGCGNNFTFYPKDLSITGIESNNFCESYALYRLSVANNTTQKNINIKDFLIGFSENMSYIRNDSMDLVLSTNSNVEDFDQTINEIYRILKKDGLFVYMENRIDPSENIISKTFKLLFGDKQELVNCFNSNLMKSQFGKEDKILVQRLFADKTYGIATK